MTRGDMKHRCGETDRGPQRRPCRSLRRSLVAASAAGTVMMLQMLPAHAQQVPATCLSPGEPLIRVPELVTRNGKLSGTLLLRSQQQRINSSSGCFTQYVRYFSGKDSSGADAALPPVMPGSPPAPPLQTGTLPDPLPGPTLRARVGDLVQLTFLNQVNPNNFPGSFDRGDIGACDESSSGYPGTYEVFPDCFHGSSTANIHFHGTHTNPNSTGDNVFLQIRPAPPPYNAPTLTPDTFKTFFDDCEAQLKGNVLSEWPYTWSDLPPAWIQEQTSLLDKYDKGLAPYSPPAKPPAQRLLPANEESLKKGQWPQYYVGAYPYCFRLPEYTGGWPPPQPPAHPGAPGGAKPATLQMGQSPGTHWYHAHKHGSTALNVLNGMTGAFIIEGRYDDDLNRFYGTREVPDWTRRQPVLVINQLDVAVPLVGGAFFPGNPGPPFSVNGRSQPTLTMRPGEVQLWRIANTSSRSGAFFVGPPSGFEWRQIAQDGVQFSDVNYQNPRFHNNAFLMASGNRVDLLVKAPASTTQPGQPAAVQVVPAVVRSQTAGQPGTLLSVEVAGTPVTGRQAQFIDKAPAFPTFLADISSAEVTGTKKIKFKSLSPQSPAQHTIDDKQFDETVGQTVLLNKVEEWKIENATTAVKVDHPFHIHINPFQVVEVFDPNQKVTNSQGQTVYKYVFTTTDAPPPDPKTQCNVNVDKPATWVDCHNVVRPNEIWWDVFPIPMGVSQKKSDGDSVTIPGYFKMRSRFVDYPGLFVIHCHILAHEDRGMMMVVEVRPHTLPVKHH